MGMDLSSSIPMIAIPLAGNQNMCKRLNLKLPSFKLQSLKKCEDECKQIYAVNTKAKQEGREVVEEDICNTIRFGSESKGRKSCLLMSCKLNRSKGTVFKFITQGGKLDVNDAIDVLPMDEGGLNPDIGP